jgi:hypothetical protein
MSKRSNKKMFLYRDVIGPVGRKYSIAEIIGTVALLAAWAVACLRVSQSLNLF